MGRPSATVLNITNGDSVVYLFKKAGIIGTHLPWRDCLQEGPVPATPSLSELSAVRAGYLASRGYGTPIKVFHDFASRDAVLMKAPDFEEVVLWFEHDLYDQLQLAQVVSLLEALNVERGRVSLVQSDAYLGSMTADEISALVRKRKTVTSAGFSAAQRAWWGFTSGDVEQLNALARTEFQQFPFMRAAFRRLIEEFPGTGDGLSRSERQALAAVAAGAAREEELFRRAQGREEAAFLGDTSFFAILRDLRMEPAPLLEADGDSPLQTTALGRRVLGGDTDWLEHQPVDRWIGGVRIQGGLGAAVPRFDERAECLV